MTPSPKNQKKEFLLLAAAEVGTQKPLRNGRGHDIAGLLAVDQEMLEEIEKLVHCTRQAYQHMEGEYLDMTHRSEQFRLWELLIPRPDSDNGHLADSIGAQNATAVYRALKNGRQDHRAQRLPGRVAETLIREKWAGGPPVWAEITAFLENGQPLGFMIERSRRWDNHAWFQMWDLLWCKLHWVKPSQRSAVINYLAEQNPQQLLEHVAGAEQGFLEAIPNQAWGQLLHKLPERARKKAIRLVGDKGLSATDPKKPEEN